MNYSHSTDKLNIIADAAQNILGNNPDIASRIKSLSVKWHKLSDTLVPDIEIQFYDSPKTGVNLQKLEKE